MLLTPRPCPIWAGPISKEFLDSATPSAASSYNITSADLGTPAPNRVIVVAVGFSSATATLSSPEINGVTSITTLTPARGDAASSYMFYGTVPTGTSGDIKFTMSTTITTYIGWWALYPRIAAHLSTDTDGGAAGELRSVELNYAPRSVGLFCGQRSSMQDWTGATQDLFIGSNADVASRDEKYGGTAVATTWTGRALIGVSFR